MVRGETNVEDRDEEEEEGGSESEGVVADSLGHTVLGWRSIPTYNFVLVRAFLFWVQDSLDEKGKILLHPNGQSDEGTMAL
ncbi:hypothetical protein Tco_0983684 [Tanacetum coccineum]